MTLTRTAVAPFRWTAASRPAWLWRIRLLQFHVAPQVCLLPITAKDYFASLAWIKRRNRNGRCGECRHFPSCLRCQSDDDGASGIVSTVDDYVFSWIRTLIGTSVQWPSMVNRGKFNFGVARKLEVDMERIHRNRNRSAGWSADFLNDMVSEFFRIPVAQQRRCPNHQRTQHC
jgi:hypothetical protein